MRRGARAHRRTPEGSSFLPSFLPSFPPLSQTSNLSPSFSPSQIRGNMGRGGRERPVHGGSLGIRKRVARGCVNAPVSPFHIKIDGQDQSRECQECGWRNLGQTGVVMPEEGAFVRFQIAREAKFLWHSYELEDGGGGERSGAWARRGEKSEEHLFPSLLNCVGAILLLFLLPS